MAETLPFVEFLFEMPANVVIEGSYGKQFVPVVKVRKNVQHQVFDMTVRTMLDGDFEEAYTQGDNRGILPTETQKNTCYAMAAKHDFKSIEEYAFLLAKSFLDRHKHMSRVTIDVECAIWNRLVVKGKEHHHVFTATPDPAKKTCQVVHDRNSTQVTSGVKDLILMKTMNSGFAGYIVDEFTDLKAIDNSAKKTAGVESKQGSRILCTNTLMRWKWAPSVNPLSHPFNDINDGLVNCMLEVFAGPADTGVYSKSAQETMYKMGVAGLEVDPTLTSIHFSFPNIHHYLVETEKFGIPNDFQVFQKTNIPQNSSGIIQLTVSRPVSKL